MGHSRNYTLSVTGKATPAAFRFFAAGMQAESYGAHSLIVPCSDFDFAKQTTTALFKPLPLDGRNRPTRPAPGLAYKPPLTRVMIMCGADGPSWSGLVPFLSSLA